MSDSKPNQDSDPDEESTASTNLSQGHDDEMGLPSSESAGSATGRVVFICVLLMLASAINYLDRQTLASASARIKTEFGLLNEQYGDIEAAFGYGFVIGSIIFGVLADVISIRWLYPIVLASWSAVTAASCPR